MDSLQFGNSRMVNDTTTCSWQPYNIMIKAQQCTRLRYGLHFHKRDSTAGFT
jgi:hypothetical protein